MSLHPKNILSQHVRLDGCLITPARVRRAADALRRCCHLCPLVEDSGSVRAAHSLATATSCACRRRFPMPDPHVFGRVREAVNRSAAGGFGRIPNPGLSVRALVVCVVSYQTASDRVPNRPWSRVRTDVTLGNTTVNGCLSGESSAGRHLRSNDARNRDLNPDLSIPPARAYVWGYRTAQDRAPSLAWSRVRGFVTSA